MGSPQSGAQAHERRRACLDGLDKAGNGRPCPSFVCLSMDVSSGRPLHHCHRFSRHQRSNAQLLSRPSRVFRLHHSAYAGHLRPFYEDARLEQFTVRPGDLPDWKIRLWGRAKSFVAGPVWLIALGFVIGLFLGHPMLLLSPLSVTKAITGQTLKYASLHEFNGSQLVNLSVVWKYISYLIPFAMYPFLWLVPYCAILYLSFRRSLYQRSLPILIFSGLYLYFMAKGYLGPYFARATMILFPGFCILVGFAFRDLWLSLKKHRAAVIVLITSPLLLTLPSIAFDEAYVRAMQQRDSRSVVREDLGKLIGNSPVTIGVLRLGGYFHTVMPTVEPLKSDKVVIRLQDAGQKADFLLAGFTGQIDPAQLNATIKGVEAQGQFKYEKNYNVHAKIFGQEFRLARFPSDMTYPFPTILVFRAKTEI